MNHLINHSENKTLHLATVFSGIGAIEHALDRMNIPHNIIFACDNGDVDIFSKKIPEDINKIESELSILANEIAKIEIQNEEDKLYKSELDLILLKTNEEVKKYRQMNHENSSENKISRKLKDICQRTGMLHEKINSFKILKELSKIPDYAEKKKFVDNLYKEKEAANKVKKTYMANYNLNDDNFHWNVSFLDGKQYENQVDLFVGGSPCQSFSLVGKQRGLADTRGTLFYEYARLVKEIRPKIFIYENVKALLSNDEGRTWETVQKVFTDLNYSWSYKVLNAKDYGIPQNRERVFVVGFRNDLNLKKSFEFPKPIKLEKKMQDFLLDNAPGGYFLPKKGVDFVTNEKNLRKCYTQIDGEIQLCQKKNQQFNWHGDFVFQSEEDAKDEYKNPQQEYGDKEKLPEIFDELVKEVQGFDDKPLSFELYRVGVEPPRVYVNSKSEYYYFIRKIGLPNISYLSIMKLKDVSSEKYIFYFKLFIDYKPDIIKYESPIIKAAVAEIEKSDATEKSKERLIQARIGQGEYRMKVIEDCLFCPFTLVNDEHLLVASHIKPWAKSNDKEKTDPKNGFAFTPTYDKLFDIGYISFRPDKTLIVSPWLSPMNQKRLSIYNGMKIDKLQLDDKRENYLVYHRENIFKS